MKKYNQTKLYYRTLCANRDVSIVIVGKMLIKSVKKRQNFAEKTVSKISDPDKHT